MTVNQVLVKTLLKGCLKDVLRLCNIIISTAILERVAKRFRKENLILNFDIRVYKISTDQRR